MSISKRVTRSLGALIILWSAGAFAVQPLEIKSVIVDETVEPVTLMIFGENLMNGSDLELWLGEDIKLDVDFDSLTNTSVTATLPPGSYEGSYQLVATTGGGTVREDDFDGVTIGAEGPQGIQGEQGPQGEHSPRKNGP